jgi:hypothetical protein
MKKLILALAIIIGTLSVIPPSVSAIPAFARKYGFNCNMCHTSFTKLNDFGQRIRDDGYQIPGQEGKEENVFETAPPISMRTAAGLMVTHNSDRNSTTSGFHLNGLDLLAAGVMHKNVSFLIIYTPRIDEPTAEYTAGPDSSNPSQLGALESANIVFSNLVPNALNVRVGRFEPAYHLFSSKRSLYLVQPYEVYAFGTPGNSFVFDDNQIGVEATGHFRSGCKYALGIVNGTGPKPDNNNAKDLYAVASRTFGRGDGQSAGQRVSGFAYLGWQPTSFGDFYLGSAGDADGKKNKSFYRVGGSVSMNYTTVNLMGLFMYGVDNKDLNPEKPAVKDYKYSGGFVRADYAATANNRLITSAMFNWVTPPTEYKEDKISAFSLLARYYLGDWTAVNVALHGEYTYRQVGSDTKVKQHDFAALIDFDF